MGGRRIKISMNEPDEHLSTVYIPAHSPSMIARCSLVMLSLKQSRWDIVGVLDD